MIKIANGVVHKVPKDVREVFTSSPKLCDIWNDLTPLARNEWICWGISGKKQINKDNHIKRLAEDLARGKSRPCCWAGCTHR